MCHLAFCSFAVRETSTCRLVDAGVTSQRLHVSTGDDMLDPAWSACIVPPLSGINFSGVASGEHKRMSDVYVPGIDPFVND